MALLPLSTLRLTTKSTPSYSHSVITSVRIKPAGRLAPVGVLHVIVGPPSTEIVVVPVLVVVALNLNLSPACIFELGSVFTLVKVIALAAPP
uniref:Uncharacterized protein n=1 Tax=uncultured marine virus TaxID=186617 RepID=A0A0F7L2U9_9VIRU|nr:hypothetical protein 1099457000262_RB2654_16416 [uncultured marine virus]